MSSTFCVHKDELDVIYLLCTQRRARCHIPSVYIKTSLMSYTFCVHKEMRSDGLQPPSLPTSNASIEIFDM